MEKNLDIRADERNYRIHPRDIDRLSPSIGEPAYVDAYGDGHYKTMILASITPHYVTFREGTMTGIGWVEVKVSRRWTGLGFAFALWRSPRGRLHCQLQEAERKEDGGKEAAHARRQDAFVHGIWRQGGMSLKGASRSK